MSIGEHKYLGWRNGGCDCSCGRRFDRVQDYDAHLPMTAPEPREDVADTCPHCGRHRPNGCLCRIPISRRYTEDEVAERVRAAAVEVIDEVQRVFDMQCPPSLPDTYVDRGAWMAHSWWNTVLGATLRNLRDRADRRAER